jgi:hypothetical protein
MKSSDKPQFAKKWWMCEKPSDVKGANLEKGLAVVEKALADAKSKRDVDSIDTCSAALRDLGGIVDNTIKKELDKKAHKDCITVLEKFEGLIKTELKRLENDKVALAAEDKKNEGDDDGEDEGKLFEPEYLYKMIKVLRSSGKELNFGFGLNKESPEASRLLLSRKGKPEKLFRALKQTGQFSAKLLMCGHAMPDPVNAKVLVFHLEEDANEPPQILKAGRRFLRNDKNLRFRKLKLVIGGTTYDDTDPDVDDDGVAAPAGSANGSAGGRGPKLAELSAIEKDLKDLVAKYQLFA